MATGKATIRAGSEAQRKERMRILTTAERKVAPSKAEQAKRAAEAKLAIEKREFEKKIEAQARTAKRFEEPFKAQIAPTAKIAFSAADKARFAYERTEQRVSSKIPTLGRISQAGASFATKHPETAKKILTGFEKAHVKTQQYGTEPQRQALAGYTYGSYQALQTKPVKTSAMFGAGLAGGKAISLVGKVGKAFGAGAKTAKLAKAAELGIVGIYGVQTTKHIMDAPTPYKAGQRAAEAMYTEVLPMGIGAITATKIPKVTTKVVEVGKGKMTKPQLKKLETLNRQYAASKIKVTEPIKKPIRKAKVEIKKPIRKAAVKVEPVTKPIKKTKAEIKATKRAALKPAKKAKRIVKEKAIKEKAKVKRKVVSKKVEARYKAKKAARPLTRPITAKKVSVKRTIAEKRRIANVQKLKTKTVAKNKINTIEKKLKIKNKQLEKFINDERGEVELVRSKQKEIEKIKSPIELQKGISREKANIKSLERTFERTKDLAVKGRIKIAQKRLRQLETEKIQREAVRDEMLKIKQKVRSTRQKIKQIEKEIEVEKVVLRATKERLKVLVAEVESIRPEKIKEKEVEVVTEREMIKELEKVKEIEKEMERISVREKIKEKEVELEKVKEREKEKERLKQKVKEKIMPLPIIPKMKPVTKKKTVKVTRKVTKTYTNYQIVNQISGINQLFG